jgi:GTPase SAR1 family protein
MRPAHGFVLVADVTSPASLEQLLLFIKQIRRTKEIDENAKFPCVLLINKIDIENERKITKEQAKQFAKNYLNGAPVFETSAKYRININEGFMQVLREIFQSEVTEPKKKRGFFSSLMSKKDADEDLALIK